MKFLQTGDWHLGKTFYELSLISDQKYFLNQLIDILNEAEESSSPYDALFVPGDIYDRAIPPAEAVTLFSSVLNEIHCRFPKLEMFFLSGNHDSAERLSFAKELLCENRIHLCTDCSSITDPVIVKNCAVYQLPFLTAGCIRKNIPGDLFAVPLRTQSELLEEAVNQIKTAHEKNYSGYKPVLSAHLFVTGSKPNAAIDGLSVMASIGTADQVSSEYLDFFDYTALGHLHSFQKCGSNGSSQNAFYSGSPLCYTFGESNDNKYFLSVEIEEDVKLEKIPVVPLHKCTVIKDDFDTIYNTEKYASNKDDFINVVSTDTIPVQNPIALLKKKFPYILAFTYAQQQTSSSQSSLAERRKLLKSNTTLEKIFTSYLADIYPEENLKEELKQEEIKLFEKFAKEASGGNE